MNWFAAAALVVLASAGAAQAQESSYKDYPYKCRTSDLRLYLSKAPCQVTCPDETMTLDGSDWANAPEWKGCVHRKDLKNVIWLPEHQEAPAQAQTMLRPRDYGNGELPIQAMSSGNGVDETHGPTLHQLTNPPDGYVGVEGVAGGPSILNAQIVGLPHVESLATKGDIEAINKKLDWITRCLANKDGSLCKDPPK